MNELPASFLSGIRVLDLTTQRAELTGRLLAELGADVLKVEPPEGAPSRRLAPFEAGTPNSLYWAATGMGKSSAVLDLETPHGRSRLRELARVADVLIESFDPGVMDSCELGEQALRTLNPALVYVSITPYGQTGPKSCWPATELTLEAAGGRIALQGDRDRPPIPVGYPQATFHAGARAAADTIIALNERALSGRGQRLDASVQAAVIWTLMCYTGYPSNTGGDPPGFGDDRAKAPERRVPGLGTSPCKDGYVVVTPTSDRQLYQAIGASVLPALRAVGLGQEGLDGIDWQTFGAGVREGTADPELVARAFEAVRVFFRQKTKLELFEWAWSNDIHLGPGNTTKDLLENPHLVAKDYWQKVGDYTHPGSAVRTTRTPLVKLTAAPALGRDQERIEAWLRSPGGGKPAPSPKRERPGEAFAGLKVADFSWVAVGPIVGKALADHGATVVRVESSTRVDYVRTLQPFKDNEVGINRSHWVNNLNTSKLGLALNLGTQGGREIARSLVDWADVVVENYTPGTMKRLGLDYETVSKGHEDLIMISTCLLGQTGPWASFAGYGPHGAAISGLHAITGWPDRQPAGPVGPYSDVIAPHYAVATLAAAILQRRRTGLGQHIDVSQVEAAIHFIEPLLLDQTVNGRTALPAGHDSPYACPHGVYPTLGRERYIAIAVETPAQWLALKSVAPLEEFADARFDSLQERMTSKERLTQVLSAWTAGWDRRELESLLIEAGVPASVVQRPTEVCTDPQLAHREFFVTLHQSEVGPIPYDGLMTRFSAKKVQMHKAAPCVGEDTDYVLRELLGLSEEQVSDLAAAGLLT